MTGGCEHCVEESRSSSKGKSVVIKVKNTLDFESSRSLWAKVQLLENE